MAQATTDLRQQVAASVNKALRDPVWFFENILNIKTTAADRKRGQSWDLDIWQRELVESVADIWRKKNHVPTRYNHQGLNKITVRAMHGPGKTFGVAGIMHWFNYVFHGTIVCTAPKEKQLRTRLWPAFRKIRSRAGDAYASLTKVDAGKIVWCGDEDWAAHAETASEPENLAGYHDDHLLFIVDEASGLKEEMYPVIEGAVSTGYIVVVILIGNPTKNIGTFYDSHMKDKVARHYHQIHVDLDKTNRVSREWVRQMAEKYGVDSPIYKIRCLGEFADSGQDQVIALQWLLNAKDAEFSPDGSHPRIRVSVDVADGGEDESVITVRRIYESFSCYLRVARFSFPTAEAPVLTAEAAARIFDEFGGRADNGDDLVVDGLGVGAGTAGILMRGVRRKDGTVKRYPVIVYKGGESSDDPSQWRCRRVQSYMVGRDELRDGNVMFADDCFQTDEDWEDFCAQMCSIHRKEGIEQKEDLETKKEMKARGIKSPDMADSWAMQYATQAPSMVQQAEPTIVGVIESSRYEGMMI